MPLSLVGDIAERGLTRVFPSPDALVDADVALALNMPRARGATIRAVVAAVLAKTDLFVPGQGLVAAVTRLKALRGIGEPRWLSEHCQRHVRFRGGRQRRGGSGDPLGRCLPRLCHRQPHGRDQEVDGAECGVGGDVRDPRDHGAVRLHDEVGARKG